MSTSYEVRLWDPAKRKDVKKRPWRLRWEVGGQEHTRQFATKTAADGRRSELKIAVNRGEPFDVKTGLPVSELREAERERRQISAIELLTRYADMKWPEASAHHRANIAEVCMWTAVELLPEKPNRPGEVALRCALRRWAFNPKQRHDAPEDAEKVLDWVAQHAPSVSVLSDERTVRRILAAMQRTFTGEPRSSHCRKRARTILGAVCAHAVEEGLMDVNHVRSIKSEKVKTTDAVDIRRVANPKQIDRFLGEVAARKPNGHRYTAYFGAQAYAALRPEEAIDLRKGDLDLPEEGGWGWLHLRKSASHVGSAWTDSGNVRDDRGLKQQDRRFVRTVPSPPQLTRLLLAHIASPKFKAGPGGQLFVRPDGQLLAECTIRRVFHKAREEAFSRSECKTPLMRRPYDLRHACVSTWLSAGVPATQVAEWAGHSVAVLLRIYAKCLAGQDEEARRRIDEALKDR